MTYAVAGVVRRRKRWHSQGESANAETSTRPERVPARVGAAGSARMARVDLDAFRWLLTDDGQALLARAAERRRPGDDPLRAQTALRRTPTAEPGRRRAHPGRAARAGRWRSSATTPPGCTSPPTASSRPPGCSVATHRAARLAGGRRRARVIDLGCGIGGDLVAFARAGHHRAGVDLDPLRVEVAPRQPRRARARRRRAGRRRHRRSTPPPFDVGLRRPGPPQRPAAAPSTSTTGRRRGRSSSGCCAGDSCVKVAPGHPARRWCPTASRPSGSATTARSRRRRCGRAGWPRPRAARR